MNIQTKEEKKKTVKKTSNICTLFIRGSLKFEMLKCFRSKCNFFDESSENDRRRVE